MSGKHKQQAENVFKIRINGKGNSVQHNAKSYKTISNQMFSHHETKRKQTTDTFTYTDIQNAKKNGTLYKTSRQEQQKMKNLCTAIYNIRTTQKKML